MSGKPNHCAALAAAFTLCLGVTGAAPVKPSVKQRTFIRSALNEIEDAWRT
jgi:hypothetical protein